MRKNNLLFILGILLFCFVPVLRVDAELSCVDYNKSNVNYKAAFSQNREICDVENDINYDITKFSIDENGENIYFKGWSYIDHMDNWGGKNLRTWIIAYVGNWDTKNWESDIVEKNILEKKDNYYAVLTGVETGNLYWSRANGSSLKAQKGRVENTENHSMVTSDNTEGRNGIYTIDWCTELASNVKAESWNGENFKSRCLYYNVGFEVNINIDKILSILGNNKEVKFRIMSSAKYQQNGDCSTGDNKNNYKCKSNSRWTTYSMTKSIDMGLHKSACTRLGEDADCKDIAEDSTAEITKKKYLEGNRISTEKLTFTFGELSKALQITANNVVPFSKDDCTDKYTATYNGGRVRLKSISFGGREYVIKGASDDSIEIGTGGKKFSSRVYEIGLKNNIKDSTVNNDKEKNKYAEYYYQSSGDDRLYTSVYVPASWVIVSGAFSLKLSSEVQSVGCVDEIYCIGGNCQYQVANATDVCNIYQKPVDFVGGTCNILKETSSCTDVNFDNVSCSKAISTSDNMYYYRVDKNDKDRVFAGLQGDIATGNGKNVKFDNTYYYFPIKFYANATYSQNAKLNIVKDGNAGSKFINNNIISKAGRYFNYAFNYEVSASWDYHEGNTWKWETTKNNTYDGLITIDVTNGTSSQKQVHVSLRDGDKLYYYENNGWKETVYNVDFYKSFVKNQMKSLSSESFNIDVSFPDSNDVTTDVLTKNAGDFVCEDNFNSSLVWETNTTRTSKCRYRIKPAYIHKSSGQVVYGGKENDINYMRPDGDAANSSIYYVPLEIKNNYQDYKFYVKGTQMSLVSEINYSYNATCSLKRVVNDLVPDNSGMFRYRTINVKNPFPTVSSVSDLPKNWQDYVKGSNNNSNLAVGLDRVINHSFDEVSYQTKKISDEEKSLFDGFGSYTENDDMGIDGNSSVIHRGTGQSSFFDVINSISNKNHCTSGSFSKNCDCLIGQEC